MMFLMFTPSSLCCPESSLFIKFLDSGLRRNDEGFFTRPLHPVVPAKAGTQNGDSSSPLRLERNFDAVPELAALVADLLEEMDALRRSVGVR
jgi:hypothetical protein